MVVTAVALCLALWMLTSSPRIRGIGVGVAITMVHPLLGIAGAASTVVVMRALRIRTARRDAHAADGEGLLAVELVGLGVTAGLPFRSAAALTVSQIEGSTGDEIAGALRSLDAGLRPDISSADIRSMFDVASSSETTGMPLAQSLTAIARERRRAAGALARERLGKLPVKMLFPLAFLILPGFVLLTVVPPLVSGLSKLGL